MKHINLEKIYFNHDTTCSECDAINIKINENKEVNIPEWEAGSTPPSPAAYIMNRCVTVKAVFSSTDPEIQTARIKAVKKNGEFGNLAERQVSFKNGTSCPACFEIPGKTPGEITAFYQEWEWQCLDIDGSPPPEKIIGTSINRIYIILDEPQPPPWDRSSPPWAEIMEYACQWARRRATPADAARGITVALYRDTGAFYQSGSSRYTRSVDPGKIFNSRKFLDNIESEFGVGEVNCRDMAKALITFSNSIGCGLAYERYGISGSYLNCVKLVGVNKRCCDFLKSHTFCTLKGRVFDATLKTYSPAGHEQWVTDINELCYSERLVRIFHKRSLSQIEASDSEPLKIIDVIKGKFSFFLRCSYKLLIDFFYCFLPKKVIPGIQIDSPLFEKIIPELKDHDPCKYFSIKSNSGKPYSTVIRTLWRKDEEMLDIIMTVAIHKKDAKVECGLFFIKKIFFKLFGIPYHISNGREKIEVYEDYCNRHNINIKIIVSGTLEQKLADIKKVLSNELKSQEKYSKEDYSELEFIPKIKKFFCQEKWLNGQIKFFLHLEVDNHGEWQPVWRVYRGKVEEIKGGDYLYTGQKPGNNNVKAIIVNDRGLLFKSNTIIVNI